MVKQIKGYSRYFADSETGQIYSNAKNKNMYSLKTYEKPDGYLAVSLWDDTLPKRNRKTFLVHRLVAETFIPNPENKPTVNHIDGNKSNNKVENLEWATFSEQEIHSFSTGLNYARKCEEANRAILTKDNVNYIRSVYPKESVESLSAKFNVSASCVYGILYNYNWVDENYKPTNKKQLSADDVRFIRSHPEIKGTELAKMFNTSPATVSEIRHNKIWKEI